MLQGWRFYIVGGDVAIHDMMVSALAIPVKGIKDADIVIFTGGTDIQPSIYGEMVVHKMTQSPDRERDRVETGIFEAARNKKKMLIGICRGAQLLNALNKGKLYQHVTRHNNCSHPVRYIDENGEVHDVPVTSDHHQMMRPGSGAMVWAWCGRSTLKATGLREEIMPKHHADDPEVIYYKSTKSLCFQPHPEWGLKSCKDLFFDCVKRAMMT